MHRLVLYILFAGTARALAGAYTLPPIMFVAYLNSEEYFMNTLNLAAAAGKSPLGQFLPNSAGVFWLSYLILIAALFAWLIK